MEEKKEIVVLITANQDFSDDLAKELSKISGYEIIAFKNGEDAIIFLNNNCKDIILIICDLVLHGDSGYVIIEKIRNTAKINRLFIMGTSHIGTNRKIFKEKGANKFIIRDPNRLKMAKEIEEILKLRWV
ncbi:MAG: hypothetical protein ABIJ28_00045 [Patescibacteria group bacterium]